MRNTKKIVREILNLEYKFREMTNEDLKRYSLDLKKKIECDNNLINKANIICEVFALVRESAYRVLGMKPYPVQIRGGLEMHYGKIVEMCTGEGKSLTITMPVVLNAYSGKGVHVITVNDYLAKRDCEEFMPLYDFLGLTSNYVISEMSPIERKVAYFADITYGTNKEFGFDYLRDNMAKSKNNIVQRELNFAIIDEVDSILIDEARTPLIISNVAEDNNKIYVYVDMFVKELVRGKDKDVKIEGDELFLRQYAEKLSDKDRDILGDYTIDEKKKAITLTSRGIEKANLYFSKNINEEPLLAHYIQNSLRANYLMKNNDDYIVKNNKIQLIDSSTNRIMDGRQYSDGLHQAIQAKERVEIEGTSESLASITLQNYFRLYNKMCGTSGTVKTERKEFKKIYNLDTVVIPTNKPVIRKDREDLIFLNEAEKMDYLVKIIRKQHTLRPILIGTSSVEKSEKVFKYLIDSGVVENGRSISILNAKFDKEEASIVAQAGLPGRITVATNMAGRGTDILLGGNPKELSIDKLKTGYTKEEVDAVSDGFLNNAAGSDFKRYYEEEKKIANINKEKVKKLGGLLVIGMEKHESVRIDNQLRGRAGRQGDPGESVFLVSNEDNIIKSFGVIVGPLTKRLVRTAQKTLEYKNYEQRKNILEYDDVISNQRKAVYIMRKEILENNTLDLTRLVDSNDISYLDIKRIAKYCELNNIDYNNIKCQAALHSIDKNWVSFLVDAQNLRDAVSLCGFGSVKPIDVYKKEAYILYNDFLNDVKNDIVENILSIKVDLPVTYDLNNVAI